MVSRIEIIGGMGSGKSTLYSAISRKLREHNHNYKNILALSSSVNRIFGDDLRRISKKRWMISYLPFAEKINLYDSLISRLANDHIYKRESEWIDFINLVMFQRAGCTGKAALTLRRMNWFIEAVYRVAAIDAVAENSDTFIVLDNGLFNALPSLAFNLESPIDFAKSYYSKIPTMPRALICVETDYETAIKRVEKRNMPRDVHVENLATARSIVSEIVKMAESDGVEIIRTSGQVNPESNAADCLKAISQCQMR